MASAPTFHITSLTGGLNDRDPAIALSDDQCTQALNVEFNLSLLGERRHGTSATTITGSGIDGRDRVTFLYRHIPSNDETGAELWAWGFTGTSSSSLVHKTTTWSTVSVGDAATLTGVYPYRIVGQSLHGKLFIAYKSSVDRLHVWDGTSFRRVGLAEPSAPTAANNGSVGTLTGLRYYRIRYTVQSGGVTLRRSEPSSSVSITPDGAHSGVTVTKPASISESETHWELEASLDDINYYVIATTVVGTTTYTDTTDYAVGYAQSFTLSEDIGGYTLIGSARYLCADGDRLLCGGSFETDSLKSRVSWTPVFGSDGVGNDERLDDATDPFKDLDAGEGGELTGLISGGLGSVYAFKTTHIYKLVRSGLRSRAYDDVTLAKDRGAIHGSVVTAVDEIGRSCIYFLDPAVGPCRIVGGEIQQCGADILTTWSDVNLDATNTVCSAVYYPAKLQIIWNVATGSNNSPTLSIVLHVDEQRMTEGHGVRRGFVTWDGNRAKALTMCLFADNINANVARSRDLVPFIGLEGLGLVHQCDTGSTDNNVAYAATITTKPYALGDLLYKFGVMSGALLAKAVSGAKINLTLVRDFGLETVTISSIAFDATASETHIISPIDNLTMGELRTVQFTFADTSPAGAGWELHQLTLRGRQEQKG